MKFARVVRRNTARRLMQEANAGRRRGGYKMSFKKAYHRVCNMKWVTYGYRVEFMDPGKRP